MELSDRDGAARSAIRRHFDRGDARGPRRCTHSNSVNPQPEGHKYPVRRARCPGHPEGATGRIYRDSGAGCHPRQIRARAVDIGLPGPDPGLRAYLRFCAAGSITAAGSASPDASGGTPGWDRHRAEAAGHKETAKAARRNGDRGETCATGGGRPVAQAPAASDTTTAGTQAAAAEPVVVGTQEKGVEEIAQENEEGISVHDVGAPSNRPIAVG